MSYSADTPPSGQDFSKEFVLMCECSTLVRSLAPLESYRQGTSARRYFVTPPKVEASVDTVFWLPTAGELALLIQEQIQKSTPREIDEEEPGLAEAHPSPFLTAKLIDRLAKIASKNPSLATIEQVSLAALHAYDLDRPSEWNLVTKSWVAI